MPDDGGVLRAASYVRCSGRTNFVDPWLRPCDARRGDALAPEPCAAPPPADEERCTADEPGADLSGCDLRERWFVGANLVKTNLSYSDLTGVPMSNATMVHADLTCSTMVGARLFLTNSAEAVFMHADLTSAVLVGADLSGADLRHADLVGANAVSVDLSGADRDMPI